MLPSLDGVQVGRHVRGQPPSPRPALTPEIQQNLESGDRTAVHVWATCAAQARQQLRYVGRILLDTQHNKERI